MYCVHLRAFACICVLFVHAPIPFDGVTKGSFLLAPCNHFLMAGGVCVFFMISGALLLMKEQPLFEFYKRRFSRVVVPLIFWSVVYVLFEAACKGTGVEDTVGSILMIPFVPQASMMWFLYVLCGIYLVVPILSLWLQKASKQEVQAVLAIWLFTTLIPYLKLINPNFESLIERTGMLYYFCGFLGYAVLGFYIRKFSTIKLCNICYISILAFSLLFPILIFRLSSVPNTVLLGSCNIAAVSLSYSIFVFFKNFRISGYMEGFVVKFAKYSFGIYLCHMLFFEPFKQMIASYHIHYAIQIPLTAITQGLISFVFVWVLSKIKFSKYILG